MKGLKKFKATVNGETLKFKRSSDGWYDCVGQDLAINPEVELCITHPFFAYGHSVPKHEFKILKKKVRKFIKENK